MLAIISRATSSREAIITRMPSRTGTITKTKEAITTIITLGVSRTIATTFKKNPRYIKPSSHLKHKMERMNNRWIARTRRPPCPWRCLSSTKWEGTCARSISLSPSSCSWIRRNLYVKSVSPSISRRTSKNRRKARTKMRLVRLMKLEWPALKPWPSTPTRQSRPKFLAQLTI
jgi:hypothetical protein